MVVLETDCSDVGMGIMRRPRLVRHSSRPNYYVAIVASVHGSMSEARVNYMLFRFVDLFACEVDGTLLDIRTHVLAVVLQAWIQTSSWGMQRSFTKRSNDHFADLSVASRCTASLGLVVKLSVS